MKAERCSENGELISGNFLLLYFLNFFLKGYANEFKACKIKMSKGHDCVKTQTKQQKTYKQIKAKSENSLSLSLWAIALPLKTLAF